MRSPLLRSLTILTLASLTLFVAPWAISLVSGQQTVRQSQSNASSQQNMTLRQKALERDVEQEVREDTFLQNMET